MMDKLIGDLMGVMNGYVVGFLEHVATKYDVGIEELKNDWMEYSKTSQQLPSSTTSTPSKKPRKPRASKGPKCRVKLTRGKNAGNRCANSVARADDAGIHCSTHLKSFAKGSSLEYVDEEEEVKEVFIPADEIDVERDAALAAVIAEIEKEAEEWDKEYEEGKVTVDDRITLKSVEEIMKKDNLKDLEENLDNPELFEKIRKKWVHNNSNLAIKKNSDGNYVIYGKYDRDTDEFLTLDEYDEDFIEEMGFGWMDRRG